MGRTQHKIGQSTLEFTFSMIVIIFLIFGMVRVFRWVGMEAANRRVMHDQTLTRSLTVDQQLSPDFYQTGHLDAVFMGNIVK